MSSQDDISREGFRISKSVIGWGTAAITTAFTAATVALCGVLWTLNGSVIRMGTIVENQGSQISELRQLVGAATASRYSASDASTDRASTVRMIDSNTSRLNEHEKQLRDLSVWAAELRGSMKGAGK
ncbi:MAG: hypothetical protein KF805_12515 [Phycisphaeraceae bacterium]|nr:hypothetical protein [Phycisphaeraceae bacterium]